MSSSNVTRVLKKLESGEKQASDELLTLVYGELRELAAAKLRHEKAGHTLEATALVHEAYLRLVDEDRQEQWDSRSHFFASAAEAMRRILIESARRKQALKRGGGMIRRVEDSCLDIGIETPEFDLLELDEALTRFEHQDEQAALLVKLRYFSGLTVPQSANILGVSQRTAERLLDLR